MTFTKRLFTLAAGTALTAVMATSAQALNDDFSHTTICPTTPGFNDLNEINGTGNCQAPGDTIQRNTISGSNHTLSGDNYDNDVSGNRNTLGERARRNDVSGFNNTLGNNSNGNSVTGLLNTLGVSNGQNDVSGESNMLGNFNRQNIVSGTGNVTGRLVQNNIITGSGNMIGDDTVDSSIMGAGNQVITGVNLHIAGAGNVVEGDENIVQGHNATVTGASNVFIGGNSTTAAIVNGDNNIVGGTGDAVTFAKVTGSDTVTLGSEAVSGADDTVALGSGANAATEGSVALGANSVTSFTNGATTTTGAAVDAVDTSATPVSGAATNVIGTGTTAFTISETNDATGGEANLGSRLVTGVADGRVNATSADAVNGSQLFQVASVANANTIAIGSNLTLINNNTTAIGVNAAGIKALVEGAAAVASMPDLYLMPNETLTFAGGIGYYDDDINSSQLGFGLGLQWRNQTTDDWSIGLAAAKSGDALSARIQGRWGM